MYIKFDLPLLNCKTVHMYIYTDQPIVCDNTVLSPKIAHTIFKCSEINVGLAHNYRANQP